MADKSIAEIKKEYDVDCKTIITGGEARYIINNLEEEIIYDLLDAINNESSSPLYQRILFGSQKGKKKYKENQMSKIFKTYGVKKFYDKNILTRKEYQDNPTQILVTIINNYLSAWEECSNVRFQSPESDTITKIAGLRYLFCIFDDICNYLIQRDKKLTKENFVDIIKDFPEALALENVKCVFCDDHASGEQDEKMTERRFAFRNEGATVELAGADMQKVLTYESKESANNGSLI